ncbi:MAG TPA: hypothetical protein VGQ38_03445 [Gaiellaceae bacterium]|nr:hypothetical protein [Gaiellaceae bacterium]
MSPRICLGATVGISFVLRVVLSVAHATPRYFPDEYIYSTLARSVAESGRLQIRGAPAHFPAVLEPLLAAPMWLTHDPALAYRLTLAMHALAMSLAAIPVYWLARRLAIGSWVALACAAFAVSIPDLVYVNYVTADAVAYPLVLGAIAAGVAAIDRPTRRAQFAFVLLSALATFARVQYVVLPCIFVLAALASERGHVIRAVRRFNVAFILFSLPMAAALAAGPGRVLGYYRPILELSVNPLGLAHWAAVDSMLLVYAGGFVLVPGAVLGTFAALIRPRDRAEGAFAWLTVGLACGLLAEAALYAANSNGSERFQERYVFALIPLLPIGFALSLSRRRLRVPTAALASLLLVLAVRVPLTGYTIGTGKQDSPFLQAVFQLAQGLSSYGSAALLVIGVVTVLTLLAITAAFRPRAGGAALLAAIVVTSLTSAASFAYDVQTSARTARTYLARDYRFVDHADLGDVSVLVAPGTPRPLISEQLFWNRSLKDVLLLPSADAPDVFGSKSVRISRDGRILEGGRPIDRPLLVEEFTNSFRLSGAKLVRRDVSSSLWRPAGVPRVTLLASGRYLDGWLAASSNVTVWPDASGVARGSLHLHLSLPPGARPMPLRLRAPGIDRRLVVRPHEPVDFVLRVESHRPWTLEIDAQRLSFLADGRNVGVHADVPSFVRER